MHPAWERIPAFGKGAQLQSGALKADPNEGGEGRSERHAEINLPRHVFDLRKDEGGILANDGMNGESA